MIALKTKGPHDTLNFMVEDALNFMLVNSEGYLLTRPCSLIKMYCFEKFKLCSL